MATVVPQLIAKGSTSRNPLKYGNRAIMHEVSARVRKQTVDGMIDFGPFRIFTKVSTYGRKRGQGYMGSQRRLTGRGLVTYLKVGQAWYRFDLQPGTGYVREFYKDICTNTSGKYCGAIKDHPELAKQGIILRNAAVAYWIAQRAQAEQTVKDPFGTGKKAPLAAGAQLGKIIPEGGLPPWALPAAIGGGILGFVLWRRNR